MAAFTLTVNGETRKVEAEPEMPLLWVLRDLLSLTGTKFGCGLGVCGACTVLIDGEALCSCVTPLSASVERDITTIEGLSTAGSHPLQQAWLAEAVSQCGYCQAGQIMTAVALLEQTPQPTDAEIMEPINCVADVRSDRCDIWAPTQNPQDVQSFVQSRVKVPVEVHVTLIGGGFGRGLEVDYAIEAAEVSKAMGAPVQLVWTREDDIQHDFYRQPTHHWLRAGWDEAGKLALWRHFMAGPGLNGVAYRVGKEVLDGGLAVAYDIPDRVSRSLLAPVPLPTGPWRAVMSGPNAFANESFVDEIAAALEQDSYEFRLALLPETDPLRAVVELAATKAAWGTPLPEGQGRGIACHPYGPTKVAMVAEVSVQKGSVQVDRVVCAVNCGTVIQPDMVVQQMEGGIVYGLTSLLKGEITFERGRVQQSNFNDYPLLQMAEMPEIEVHIVPDTGAPQGVGEMAVPPVVPAVTNAIFAATGIRIRRIPIRAEDLQA